jgi:hypothetical protein
LKSQKKRLHIFPVTDYHLRASGGAGTLAGPMAGKHLLLHLMPHFPSATTTRRSIMAKGQQRKTKEAKKPKKQPVPAKLSGQR